MNSTLWNRTAYDTATLAADLLVLQKAQCRVEHVRDDALIPTYTAGAIAIIEKRANINVAAATFETVGALTGALNAPCQCFMGAWAYLLPFNNVREARVFDAADADVSAGWSVVQEAFGSNRDAYLMNDTQAALPSGGRVELDVGLDDVTTLDPALLMVVLRIGASLYEYREANLALTEDAFRAELMQVWRPTA